ncbi:MAG TPA: tetratricopeptide repeat protein [Telluria sp.]|nr:tetratricopeptide repeat protein [Telluria sp.]
MRSRTFWIILLAAVLGVLATVAAWQMGTDAGRERHVREQREQALKRRFDAAVALLNARQYDEAASAWHEVLAIAPKLPEAHVNLGYSLIGLKQYGLARDFFNSALELNKNQTNAYFGLALALDELGDREGALGAMRAYVHLAPKGDRYRAKAEAAIWEWEAARSAGAAVPENGNAPLEYPIRGKKLR